MSFCHQTNDDSFHRLPKGCAKKYGFDTPSLQYLRITPIMVCVKGYLFRSQRSANGLTVLLIQVKTNEIFTFG